jgi:hypothetical protein
LDRVTLPARARRLTIGDLRYRWLVSDRQAPDSLSLWIQEEAGTGARVEARLNFELAVSSAWGFRQTTRVTSGVAARAVKAALEEGWDPRCPGPDRRIQLWIDSLAGSPRFHNPEPLRVTFESHSSPRVRLLSAEAFPRSRWIEVVIERDRADPERSYFTVVLRDHVLGTLWAEVFREDDFHRHVAGQELPMHVGTLDAPHHDIEQGLETLCWAAGEDVFIAAGRGDHFDSAATRQQPFETWVKVERAALSTAWRTVLAGLHRRLPSPGADHDEPT